MIALEQAKEQAWTRFSRGMEEDDVVQIVDAAPGMCVGTDVRGPELAQHLLVTMEALWARMLADPDSAYPLIMGSLGLIFWVGFEFGKAEEQ